jgi:protein involved in polysaccharide export with SLBB domain
MPRASVADDVGVARSEAAHPPRALRLSLTLGLFVAVAALGYAMVTVLPQADLLTNTLWRAAPRQVASSPAVRGNVTAVPAAAPAVVKPGEGTLIAYGDRLKITFFESVGVALDNSGATSDRVLATVFPRMDLSAEYPLDEAGNVNIPKLGQFATAGRTIPALQSDLAAGFKRVIGRDSEVNVAIVERQPIYVLGTVRNAGTFKYKPGMIVLQALADAGGADLGVADTSRAIEAIREAERLRQAQEKLDRLQVKQAVLIAERDNADSIEVPASIKSRLSAVTPHDGLNALLAGAAASLAAERKSYQQQLSLAQRQVGIARAEIAAQNMRADQLKLLLATKTSRLHELQEIATRGSVSQYKLTDASVDVSELIAKQEDLHVVLAQADRRMVEAEIAQAKLELDHSVGLEKELAVVQQDIDDSNLGIASMQAVIRVLGGRPDAVDGSASPTGLRITRRLADGFTVIPATETTPLLPGDIIEVSSAGHSNGSASGIAQYMRGLLN